MTRRGLNRAFFRVARVVTLAQVAAGLPVLCSLSSCSALEDSLRRSRPEAYGVYRSVQELTETLRGRWDTSPTPTIPSSGPGTASESTPLATATRLCEEADVSIDEGNHERAKALLEESIAHCETARAYNNLGCIYQFVDEDLERARSSYEAALRVDPTHVQAAENLRDL